MGLSLCSEVVALEAGGAGIRSISGTEGCSAVICHEAVS